MRFAGIRARSYLHWLGLAVFVPWLLFTCVTVWYVQNGLRQQQEAVLIDQARAANQVVNQMFEHLESGLLSLAASSALRHDDLDSFHREMQAVSVSLGDIPIGLIAPDGRVLLCVGAAQPGEMAENGLIRQDIRAAIQMEQPVITNLLAPADPAHRAVAFAVPVVRFGSATMAAMLVGTLNGKRLADLVKLPEFHPDGLAITLHDRDGVVVASSQPDDHVVGQPGSPDLQSARTNRHSGLLTDNGRLDGQPAILAFSLSLMGNYSVVVAMQKAAFGADMRRALLRIILIGAAFLILSLCAAAYLARHLVAALRTVGRGNPTLVSSGIREVDELAITLNTISQQREEAVATLQESEARLRELTATLDLAAIMTQELNGTIRFWSRGCERMYGWTEQEALGRASHVLLRTRFPVRLAQIEQALITQGEWKGDLVQQRRDGTLLIVAAHKGLKRDGDGRPYLVMESLVDVTALREAQEALKDLNQGVEQRVRDEIATREVAQQRAFHAERVQALGQLAGGIAHDFNNVLQAIAGGAALIARRPHEAEAVARLIQVVCDAAARGAAITRRMLVLARQGDLKAEPVDVNALLYDMRDVFIHTLGAAINVQVAVAAGLPRLLADKAQLETVLVNLATNARDAMVNGGTLRLAAGLAVVETAHSDGLAPGCYIRLSVADDGEGMSPTTLARACEPFFTTKEVGKGTGLGLSMVKGFADQSGGGFALTSTLGFGTTATIWLPAVKNEVNRTLNETLDESHPRLTGRILLVDDDKLVRDTLVEQLEDLGHKVLAASGGTDALALLRARGAVDLMITDLSMPGMDGLMLIREAHGLWPSLPAILLTGYAGDADVLENSGVAKDTYTLLRKPTTSALLSARVTALLVPRY